MASSKGAQARPMRPPRVLLAAGGTGGHVYPAVAVADALVAKRKDVKLAFVGADPPREEARAVPNAGYGVPWKVPAPRMKLDWTFPWRATRSVVLAMRHLVRFRPDVVVGTGGYVAAPTCVAAAILRVPLLLLEPNARPGKTNRWLARIAKRTCVAFPEAIHRLPGPEKVLVTGTPTRTSVHGASERKKANAKMELLYGEKHEETNGESDGQIEVICVFGGSLGAAKINQAVMDAFPGWLDGSGVFLLWQTGPNHYQDVLRGLELSLRAEPWEGEQPVQGNEFFAVATEARSLPRRYSDAHDQEGKTVSLKRLHHDNDKGCSKMKVVPFLDRVDLAYAAADVVVARAGAITCAELLAAGLPSILVPAPNVAEDHQTFNARAMERAGASMMVRDRDLDDGVLEGAVVELLKDRIKRQEMGQSALKAAIPDAANRVAQEILLLAAMQQEKQGRQWGWLRSLHKNALRN